MSAARFYEISMGFSAAGFVYQSWLLDLYKFAGFWHIEEFLEYFVRI